MSDGPVSEDRSGRVFSLPAVNYELPDGTLLEVGGDRFLIPELLLDTAPLLHLQASLPCLVSFRGRGGVS